MIVLGFEPHNRSLNNIGPGFSSSSIHFSFGLLYKIKII